MTKPSRVEDIFFAALEKDIPAERAEYVRQACSGDETLRTRLETLLAAHSDVGGFLERPIAEAPGLAALENLDTDQADLAFLLPSTERGSLGRLDHFEILEVVGRGGMGIVLRARDTRLGRIVAIKALAASLAASAAARRRFAREARAAAAVRDDHVVAIHDVCDSGPVPYLVMELIDGGSLETRLRRDGPLPVDEVLRIGVQMARGLAAAHRQNLIHRDIKPSNILLESGSRRVKLTDFGLARAADDATITLSGLIAGTPLYMSPEQAAGQRIDCRADLFSLGSVLYEMCARQSAFQAPTTLAVIRRVCDETPQPIRDLNSNIPASLCRLIERLHAKQPADRPASAQEVAEELNAIASGLNATLKGLIEPTPQARRRRIAVAAVFVALCVLIGLSEVSGVTNMLGMIIRVLSPEGTLVVEVDDPDVSVAIDGTDVVVTSAGAKEFRLKPGQYRVEAAKTAISCGRR